MHVSLLLPCHWDGSAACVPHPSSCAACRLVKSVQVVFGSLCLDVFHVKLHLLRQTRRREHCYAVVNYRGVADPATLPAAA
jgi:hypothetical protein